MANPKYKTPRSKTRKRRSHLALTLPNVVLCSNPSCRQPKLQHHICKACGQYSGMQVLASKDAEENA